MLVFYFKFNGKHHQLSEDVIAKERESPISSIMQSCDEMPVCRHNYVNLLFNGRETLGCDVVAQMTNVFKGESVKSDGKSVKMTFTTRTELTCG